RRRVARDEDAPGLEPLGPVETAEPPALNLDLRHVAFRQTGDDAEAGRRRVAVGIGRDADRIDDGILGRGPMGAVRAAAERERARCQDQGDAGQHQLTLDGNAAESGPARCVAPNCSTMSETACTLTALRRRKSHWSAFTHPTRSHCPFGETASVPKSPGAEWRKRASPGFDSAWYSTRSLRPVPAE